MQRKVCLIIHSLGLGGMERVMAILARYFFEIKKEEVHLILIGLKREVAYDLPEGIRIHKPPFEFNNASRTFDTLRTASFLRNEVQSIEPDVVLSFGEFWNNLVLLALYGLKVPVFISDRSRPNKDLGRLQNRLRDHLYPKATGYIAQTEIAAKMAKNRGWNKNIKVIGNPIRAVESNRAEERNNIVLSIGRLIPTKNFDSLIRIFSEIHPDDWKLIIIGGNAKRMNLLEEYQKLVKALNMEDRIELTGEVANVDAYLKQSKIFAFPSSSEGFPNALGEALNAGLACVSYDCMAGPSDMITDGVNGFLVKMGDEESFRKKIELLMSREDLRREFSNKAKETMRSYEVDHIADKFYNFITVRS